MFKLEARLSLLFLVLLVGFLAVGTVVSLLVPPVSGLACEPHKEAMPKGDDL